jgi:UDP-sulfoquinovose synthase
MTGASVEFMTNPRFEAAENDLHVENKSLIGMGLEPITLSKGLMLEVHDIATKYKDRCDRSKIPATSLWRK